MGPYDAWGEIRLDYPPPPRPVLRYKIEDLHGWQTEVIEKEKLRDPCDPEARHVVYIWSPHGSVGKTRMALTLVDQQDRNWLMVCGSVANISYLITKWYQEFPKDELHGVIIDVPRCATSREDNHAWFSVSAVEAICNGYIVNTKYECSAKRINRPHVVIFANTDPPYEKLSADRWHVYCLDGEGQINPAL